MTGSREQQMQVGGIRSLVVAVAAVLAVQFAGVAGVRAQADVQLIMYEQYACEWCEVWNEEVGVVYHKTTEGKRAPLRRVDIHDSIPADLKALRPGRYTPTFVLTHNGVEIGRITGYPGEDFFWGMLDQLMKKLPEPSGPRIAQEQQQ